MNTPAGIAAAVPAGALAAPGPGVATATPGWLGQPRAALRHWWLSRLPRTDNWTLGQRNIYILPTRAGLTFGLTLVAMLLASINYQLNLGYALTFLLAGAGAVSMHLTHGNLRGLALHVKAPSPVFAGTPAAVELVITNPGRARHALMLGFGAAPGEASEQAAWCDVPAQGQHLLQLARVPPHRGWHALPPLVVQTVFPFGLFRAWTVWRPAARLLAWPQPEHPAPPLPARGAASSGELPRPRTHGSEFDGVRPWQRGDTMRQVVWKKGAHAGELVSRETVGAGRRELQLDWSDAGIAGTEPRLQRLAAWVLAAERDGLTYALRLPGADLPSGSGESHRRAALDLLALWA
ncbi:MAG: DUF58 domain-containing protein [Pseudomonadota bacterium]